MDYQINVSESIATTIERQRIEQFLNQVYAPLNIQPEYVYYPSQRGLPLVNTGEIDAEAARYEFAVKEYRNLIQIPEPLGTIATVILCSKEQHCQLSPNRTVGVLQGFLMAKEFCRNEDKLCYFTENPSVLGKLLDSQRVEAILVRRNQIPSIVCNSDNNDFYAWHYRDFDLPTHHYVHRDNEHLVDALTNSIRVQKNTSIYLQITQQWLARAQQCGKTITTIPQN
ncbi:transporter substrate-binding domain-containing protein [Alteromonas sp. ASW11-36]|uniref:Transporter substrate-binding domain-containing protein n=1 Tax=Alteromonas arenosi TaxID=3055817 RepID=A0ABT7SYK0_9ALTE|nr:transporter substrate-binding domain-containing protein [Alteromonas sp. ASW11-36]MDM7861266.1 transporter substrate-binding domain-containing protein [Alteromonas sp. ASW11-36]